MFGPDAGRLMPAVREVARRFGRRRIILWGGVHASNRRALRFYDKSGFVRVGSAYRAEGASEDCFDMLLDLDPQPNTRG